MALNSPTISS